MYGLFIILNLSRYSSSFLIFQDWNKTDMDATLMFRGLWISYILVEFLNRDRLLFELIDPWGRALKTPFVKKRKYCCGQITLRFGLQLKSDALKYKIHWNVFCSAYVFLFTCRIIINNKNDYQNPFTSLSYPRVCLFTTNWRNIQLSYSFFLIFIYNKYLYFAHIWHKENLNSQPVFIIFCPNVFSVIFSYPCVFLGMSIKTILTEQLILFRNTQIGKLSCFK